LVGLAANALRHADTRCATHFVQESLKALLDNMLIRCAAKPARRNPLSRRSNQSAEITCSRNLDDLGIVPARLNPEGSLWVRLRLTQLFGQFAQVIASHNDLSLSQPAEVSTSSLFVLPMLTELMRPVTVTTGCGERRLTMVTQGFLRNRAEFPRAELTKHQGKWVAFSADGRQIVAAAETLEQLEAELATIGADPQKVVFECVPAAEDDIFLGAGE
jgi:hypothetical protein